MNISPARGFTLIELLVVIAIIGLLSSVILTSLNVAREHADDATRKSNLVEIQKALQGYYDDNGRYPTGGNGGDANWAGQCQIDGNVAQNSVIANLVSGGYISQLPSDVQMVPSTNSCCYQYEDTAGGKDYKYMFFGCSAQGSAAGTGPMSDAIHTGAWSVYSPGGASL
jgi:general secretion pathway protein G